MPHIAVTIGQGRSPEQLRTLLHEVHAAVLRSVDTRPEHVRIVLHEVPRTHWSTAGTTLAESDQKSIHPTEPADHPTEPAEFAGEREPS
ncbi:tautomerase family protein [Streptomyces sp. 8L]|uniref:tautomerase family protein n=1 Tax=Streptomyces sp. 8L TaxID=2877242 RepID=UPI001CD5EC93|nr:tautomerase family protein [Streptomyces sp. 8L]MCA1217871.1 tautomerase family protein [Streptomyces sp. 8L]